MYNVDPNDSTKSVPKARPISAHGKATTPAAEAVVDRPNYVLVNMNGTYAFAYQSGSVGSYTTGSVVDDAAGPVRLDINPVAWRQTDAAGTAGDVTFVYIGDVG
ncbi:hypothetical protein HOE22_11985 [Candidatus Woesearchaeota archaeon]|nr:hypothetical protein [Candidatus Woesearchaeota archaeon]MBT7557021.1 hypothetical protein [Candidatus Woesearchaeota archaeon]